MSYDAKKAAYQEVTILGRPALFAECRIDNSMEPFIRALIMGVNLRPRPPDEYAEIRRQLAAIGNNINQIARAVNARGFATKEEIAVITAAQEMIWTIAERL